MKCLHLLGPQDSITATLRLCEVTVGWLHESVHKKHKNSISTYCILHIATLKLNYLKFSLYSASFPLAVVVCSVESFLLL